MDKCREEFEKQKYWIGLFRDAVDFDEELGRYVLNGQRKLYAFHLDSFNEKWAIWQEAWQHQQAKVEELQKRVDAVIIEIENMYLSGAIGFDTVKKLEQAIKGGRMNYKKGDKVYYQGNKYNVLNAFDLQGKQVLTLKNNEIFIKGFVCALAVKPVVRACQ
nr:hypothetical protein [Acinetobacter nosocomialis]